MRQRLFTKTQASAYTDNLQKSCTYLPTTLKPVLP